jgi:transglutaminase-like putative cysteine protease
MIAAPALDRHTPWLDYQALAGKLVPAHLDTFDWTQRYGPLHWPRTGREVLDVQGRHPDYWKAENLDLFDGRAWTNASLQTADPQSTVDPRNIQRWTQTLHVTIRTMKTTDVLAAGVADAPTHVTGAIAGFSDGTWADPSGLGPGDSYDISTYDPNPSAGELAASGTDYPGVLVPAYLSLAIPQKALGPETLEAPGTTTPITTTQVIFPPFGTTPAAAYGRAFVTDTAAINASPYARVYALARRLARHAVTPYAYAMSIKRYLSGNGFAYNENPPRSGYPLASFLLSDRVGYCQQFAGSMALLLRMGGIPARVAAGFTTGTYDSATRSWVVTDRDAHAWVEGWFPHYGWVRFDPTPPTAPARGGHVQLPAIKGSLGNTSASGHPSRGLVNAAGAPVAGSRQHGGHTAVGGLIAAGVLLVVLAVALRSMVRIRESTVEELLSELERAFGRCGRPLAASTTLAVLEQRLGSSPEAQAYVRGLRLTRFGGGAETHSRAQRRALRGYLSAGLGVAGLARAIWALPPRFAVRRIVSEWSRRGIHSR